jgi:hypothetical protein
VTVGVVVVVNVGVGVVVVVGGMGVMVLNGVRALQGFGHVLVVARRA